jgi:hypothetical protein
MFERAFELFPAAGDVLQVFHPFQRLVRRDVESRLEDRLDARRADEPREDEGLRPRARLGESAFDEEVVEADFFLGAWD